MQRREERPLYISCLIWLITPVIGTLVCALIFTLFIDTQCAATLQGQIVVYPGAERVEENHNLIRPYAMGVTRTTLHVDAPYGLVKQWYQRETGHVSGYLKPVGNAQTTWYLSSRPGGGSEIRLLSECAGW